MLVKIIQKYLHECQNIVKRISPFSLLDTLRYESKIDFDLEKGRKKKKINCENF